MELLVNILFGIFFFGVIFTISFFFHKKPLPYYFFIASYIIFLISLFNNIIVANGVMLKLPHFFRVISPFQFLLAPLSFLFCRSMLRPHQKLSWRDSLHIIPFIISVIGLIPVYTLSADEKREFIRVTSVSTGLINIPDAFGLPFYLTLRIKFGLFMIYTAYQLEMLIRFRKKATESLKKLNRTLIFWITFDTYLKTFFGIFIFLSTWITVNIPAAALLQISLVSFELLTSASFLIFYPQLLQGIVFQQISFGQSDQYPLTNKIMKSDLRQGIEYNLLEAPPKLSDVSSEDDQKLLASIEEYFQLEQPFLNPSFSLTDLSKALAVQSRLISHVIKSRFGVNFPEYINEIRFNYLEETIRKKPEVLQFSIDAISKLIGFNSRSGFYKAFKKYKKFENPGQLLDFYRNMR